MMQSDTRQKYRSLAVLPFHLRCCIHFPALLVTSGTLAKASSLFSSELKFFWCLKNAAIPQLLTVDTISSVTFFQEDLAQTLLGG